MDFLKTNYAKATLYYPTLIIHDTGAFAYKEFLMRQYFS